MTDLYETVVADTSYEAEQIAIERFGKNIEIVNTETVQDKIYLGLGKHERVKITVKICNNQFKNNNQNPSSSPYILPTPHNPYFTSINDSTSLRETQSSYEPRTVSTPRPVTVPPNIAKDNYRRTQSRLRKDIDGLHGIQEEDSEIKSEKILKNKDYSKLKNDLLESITKIKNVRKKEKAISGELKSNSINSKKFEEIQEKLDFLTEAIKQLTQNSNSIINENQLPQGLSDIEKELQNIETPQEIIKELFKDLRLSCDNKTLCESKAAFSALHSLIKNKLPISNRFEIKKSSSPQVIVLMGPTGVGKTTTIAKLAAQFCFNTEKPIKACFLNIDFYKLGAKDQLQKYAEIFQIPLEDISSVASLDYYLTKHKDDDLIIVDTAGRSQYAYKDIEELKTYLNRIPNATKYLTISSTSKYSDLQEIVKSFGIIGFDHIILTKTDETKTIGPAVGMLLKSNKSLAYITHGQSVPEDYRIADFDFFEEKMFQGLRHLENQEQLL